MQRRIFHSNHRRRSFTHSTSILRLHIYTIMFMFYVYANILPYMHPHISIDLLFLMFLINLLNRELSVKMHFNAFQLAIQVIDACAIIDKFYKSTLIIKIYGIYLQSYFIDNLMFFLILKNEFTGNFEVASQIVLSEMGHEF